LKNAGKPPDFKLLQHDIYLVTYTRAVSLEKHCAGDLQRVSLTNLSHVTRCEKCPKGRWSCSRIILQEALSAQSPGEGNICIQRTGTQFPQLISFTKFNAIFQMHNVNFNVQFKELCINHLMPNGHFSGRTAPLSYRCCICLFIQQIYVLNILNMLHTLRLFLFKMPFIS
jgi:hypothetical protein